MALVSAPTDSTQRHVLLIGTTVYQDGWADIGAGVLTELEAARKLFVDKLGYDTCNKVVNPNSSDLKKEIASWRAGLDPGPGDWLLVYYTGHGVERAGMLQVITTDIKSRSPETASNAQDLITSLFGDSHPSHVLVIIDTCQSAAAQLDVASTATRLREAQGGAARGADFHVLTTARSIDTAWVGQFIGALDATMSIGTAAGTDEEHVQIAPAVEAVNAILDKAGAQRAGYAGAGERASRFLPNPRWVPRLLQNMESDARARVLHRIQSIALRSHWNPRARGVATEHDAGWFFTGRSRALRRIVQWLGATDAARGLLITGLPGSGKSAVLARIITLADPQQRKLAVEAGALQDSAPAELPAENAIDAALHARAKDPIQLALEMSAALGLDVSSAREDAEAATVAALERRTSRVVVAIDALDEAQRPYDCAAFLRRLLQKSPQVHLLIGVRSSGALNETLVGALGTQIERLDLDAAEWYDKADIGRYVRHYLSASPGSPYATSSDEELRQLAGAVGERAGTSFLVASVTAHALASRPEIMKVDAGQDWLPSTVGEALSLDLARFSGSAGEQIRAVLLALASGFGRGLPKAEWLALARLHSDGDLSEWDLDRISREAGFYIVSDEEFGAPVRRLYHEEFSRHLHSEIPLRQLGAIPQALLDLLPRAADTAAPAWPAASSYLLMYYPAHLVALNRGTELLSVTTSPAWIEAKRRRFVGLEPVLSDLDFASHVARIAEPPDLLAAMRVSAIYTSFATVAPPLAIDVLAALGEPGRAELLATNIEFPLDRCHAFSLLAIRYAKAGNMVKASSCLRLAERAARTVRGHFSTMASYWTIHAALVSGLGEFATATVSSVHRSLGTLRQLQRDTPIGKDVAGLGFQLWAQDRLEEDKSFAIPHWLFWAAMCLREAGDDKGLSEVRDTLAALSNPGNNLSLQTAGVTRDVAYLRSRTFGIVKPRNFALALVEAGLIDEFNDLRRQGVLDSYDYADSAKRYAWALARQGETTVALEIAASIHDDLEEQARAYFHLSQVALEKDDRSFADAVATRAAQLVAQLTATGPLAVPRWRVETWIAQVMLAAGRTDEARRLTESVVEASVAPARENSLAMATPRTAESKGHLFFDSAVDIDEGVIEAVLQAAGTSGTPAARDALQQSGSTQRTQALSLAALAGIDADSASAFALWFDALTASRLAGRKTLIEVVEKGRQVLQRVASSIAVDDLHATIAAVDREFTGGGDHAGDTTASVVNA